ncbi:hypothetical protein CO709_07735 [Burkholderia thailandensis]|nr:hypothetical protein CO709_07735 [Burkholderia thailandensis]KST71312.1 hypothetical protein WS76_22340 [Burkholderia humptydooensis]
MSRVLTVATSRHAPPLATNVRSPLDARNSPRTFSSSRAFLRIADRAFAHFIACDAGNVMPLAAKSGGSAPRRP